MTTAERSSGSGGVLVFAGIVVGFLLLAMASVVPPEGMMPAPDVQLGAHAAEKHGTDADVVRAHFAQQATQESFWHRPPCRDGRHRFIARLPDGRWAVWVLQQVGPMEYAEITAFISGDWNYVKGVSDDCGHGSWLGHAYGG